jgi:hypothetical protein
LYPPAALARDPLAPEAEGEQVGECRVRRKGGMRLWPDSKKTVLRDATRAVVGYLGVPRATGRAAPWMAYRSPVQRSRSVRTRLGPRADGARGGERGGGHGHVCLSAIR